ncbi:serine/threonine-protein kinase [Salix suchowensis]|nr:serine/threonine-protein kinase [Salix suchowensis]
MRPRWGAISKGTVETRFTSSSVVRDGPGDREAAIFTYKELSFATSSFRAESFLGSGGFGAVYKGKLESTGQGLENVYHAGAEAKLWGEEWRGTMTGSANWAIKFRMDCRFEGISGRLADQSMAEAACMA